MKYLLDTSLTEIGNLNQAYQAMAADEERECEALEWSENLVGESHAAR